MLKRMLKRMLKQMLNALLALPDVPPLLAVLPAAQACLRLSH